MKYFRFGHRINILARLFTRKLNEKFLGTGITSSQFPVIIRLCEHDKLTQNEICEQLLIEPSTISKTLDNMEKMGWVVRIVAEADKREKRVELSDKAKQQFPAWLDLINDLQSQIINGIPGKDLEVFDRVLLQIEKNLKGISNVYSSH